MTPYGVTRPQWVNFNPLIRIPEYSRQTRSISWLLIPWLLMSPCHQHPRYWSYKAGRSLSSEVGYYQVNVNESYKFSKFKTKFVFLRNNSGCNELMAEIKVCQFYDPFYKRPWAHHWNSFCSNFDSNNPIGSQICTCHDSYAKLWHDMIIIFHVRAICIFHKTNYELINHLLTHWGRDKMAATSQKTLLTAFSWMKLLEFRLKFHWTLFLRVQLTIFQHWFR